MQSESYAKYSISIQKLKNECLNAGLSEDEFKNIYFDSLSTLEKEEKAMLRRILDFIKNHKVLLVIMVSIYIYYNSSYVYSTILCKLQDYIYSGLRVLRKLFIPIISVFPSLTEYYHETCLIQNPFFTVVDMDCWPCSTVSNIREVVNPGPIHNQHTAPFIYKTDQPILYFHNIRDMYVKNYIGRIESNTAMILMNNEQYMTPLELFQYHSNNVKNYYVWKLNNMEELIALRQMIPRPTVVPRFGQSLERYLIIDTSQKSYRLPDTECGFAYILSLSGTRTIQLTPAEECKHQCKSLQVVLKDSHLLWYNWWYWKPEVLSTSENSSFIGHIGSYCEL